MLLTDPQGFIEARTAEEVPGALTALEAGVATGLIAAGYCAYELGYVFEPRLRDLMPEHGGALLRFYLFNGHAILDAKARARWLLDRAQGGAFPGKVRASLDPEAYRRKHERVRQLIGDGDVYQVNLTMKLVLEGDGDPFETYRVLREKSRAGACAFLRFADEDVLSFSPETFFRIEGGCINARPMKGTTTRAPDLAADLEQRRILVADEKQRAENLMIVDLLRNDLARVSKVGSVEVSDLFTVETYPTYHTLTSGVRGTLKMPASLSRVLPALFPCGSVTGAPKIRAMEIIREVEDEPRGVYCGAVGYAMREAMAFNVAIRTISLRGGRAEMGVGGGIVWDSEASSEHAECLLKARFLTEPHDPFRLIETMRWRADGGFHLIERHLARLKLSSRYFGFRFDEAAVRRHLEAAVAGAEGTMRVRLTLGVRGDTQAEAVAIERPSGDGVWRFAIATTRVNSADWRLYHKTTRREPYDEALSSSGCDEVVLVNERGELTEGSRTNLFVERDGVWLTPPLSSGLLGGCLRQDMLESGVLTVREQILRAEDLEDGTVWFGNSLRGLIRGVRAIAPADGIG